MNELLTHYFQSYFTHIRRLLLLDFHNNTVLGLLESASGTCGEHPSGKQIN